MSGFYRHFRLHLFEEGWVASLPLKILDSLSRVGWLIEYYKVNISMSWSNLYSVYVLMNFVSPLSYMSLGSLKMYLSCQTDYLTCYIQAMDLRFEFP